MANVLLLCDTFAPAIGGSEKMLLDLARGLAARGDAVVVLTPTILGRAGETKDFDAGEPYVIHRSAAWAKLFQLGGSPRAVLSRVARLLIVPLVFRQVLAIKQVDVLIVGHPVPLGNVAAALKRMRPAMRTIVMTYGEEVTVYSRGARMRGMLIDALCAADAVTCLTQDTAEEIGALDEALRGSLEVVPPAVGSLDAADADAISQLRRELRLENKRVVLTLSRLVPRKGFDVTMRAVAALREEFPELVYLIAGHGPDQARLEKLAHELGLTEDVRFMGAVPKLAVVYGVCDVFCMPNRQMPDGEREGFGIVFLEAGLCGKPIIGGRSGGAVDAIVDSVTGLLVDPESVEEVAGALRKLLKDRELAERLGSAGRERALREFSTERFVGRYAELIDAAGTKK